MEGCNWRGGSVCVNCGSRLTCICGQFVRERDLAAHENECPTVARLARTEGEGE